MRTARSHRTLATITALFLATAAPSSADVLVVDASGSGDFTDIQPAVDAALDDDVILVRTGSYSRFVVAHKGVQILADTDAQVDVVGGIQVLDTLVQHTVVLAGLDVTANIHVPVFGFRHAVELSVTRGPVRIESCELRGSNGGLLREALGGTGIKATFALDLAVVNTRSEGGIGGAHYAGVGELNPGGHGLSAESSFVSVYDSELIGGKGGFGDQLFCDVGGDGGSGAFAASSTLFASGTQFVAGNGDEGVYGGDGGNGIYLDATRGPTEGYALDCTFTAGLGDNGFLTHGDDGVEMLFEGQVAWTVLPGTARSLVLPTPARESMPIEVELSGEPGESAFLLLSFAADSQLVLPLFGSLVLQLPLAQGRRFMGVIPPSGTLVNTVPALTLPPGVLSWTFFTQSLFQSPSGEARLGGFSTLSILDSSL